MGRLLKLILGAVAIGFLGGTSDVMTARAGDDGLFEPLAGRSVGVQLERVPRAGLDRERRRLERLRREFGRLERFEHREVFSPPFALVLDTRLRRLERDVRVQRWDFERQRRIRRLHMGD